MKNQVNDIDCLYLIKNILVLDFYLFEDLLHLSLKKGISVTYLTERLNS